MGSNRNNSRDPSYPNVDMNDSWSSWPVHTRQLSPHVWYSWYQSSVGSSSSSRGSQTKENKESKQRRNIVLIEDQLAYLSDECTIISIIFDSVRNAYSADTPHTSIEQAFRQATLNTQSTNNPDSTVYYGYSSDVIKEIKIAIDELLIQLKQLDKKMKALENERCKLINDEGLSIRSPLSKESENKRRTSHDRTRGKSKRPKRK
ncbi:hypothetical protein G6F56_010639 [Rhizopus delemar]|nr:hypothetical protein G6F56_010639 [Rhizopus delemar]